MAHVDPFANNLNGTTIVNGKKVALIQQGGGKLGLGETPIGPTWDPQHYFLGADSSGRDVAARMLYGGRSSLLIGIGSARALLDPRDHPRPDRRVLRRRRRTRLLSRMMDVIWAFPVYPARDLRRDRAAHRAQRPQARPVHITASSLWLPTLIIALHLHPVRRTVRCAATCSRCVKKEFVQAAIAQGASNRRLVFREILPNVVSVVIVLLPLMIATTILTESALSFLGVGVQPPNASWGTIIGDGQRLLYTRPWVAIAPGIMILLTVLSLNVLG